MPLLIPIGGPRALVETLYDLVPNSLISSGSWSFNGVDHLSAIQPPDDDGSSYIQSLTDTDLIKFGFGTVTIPGGGVVNYVKVIGRHVRVAGSGVSVNVSVAVSGGSPASLGDFSPQVGYTTEELTATAKPGGGAWDQTALDGLEAYLTLTTPVSGVRGVRLSTLRAVVSISAP